MFYLKRSSKKIPKIIFNSVYTLFLFIHGINKKEKKGVSKKNFILTPYKYLNRKMYTKQGK